jgi:hypothetical protein
MSSAARNYDALSDAERKDREALLRSLVVRPKPSAEVVDHPARRRPLGLAILDGDDAEPEARATARAATPGVPAMRDDPLWVVMDLITECAATMDETQARVAAKFAEVRAEFGNQVTALRNENTALRLILENLRVTQRGERGIDGDRGPPGAAGRDGLQGPIGPRGERGEQGPSAPMIAAWEPRPEQFQVTPVFSDGSRGVPLNFRPLFEQYDAATAGEDW